LEGVEAAGTTGQQPIIVDDHVEMEHGVESRGPTENV
jgi:hypothetical protein